MCSKKKSRIFRTVTFRLTLWYAALFAAMSLAVFLVVYIALSSSLRERTDEDLLNTAHEFEARYSSYCI